MRVLPIFRQDPEMVVWWASRVECGSAVAQAVRGGKIDQRLEQDARHWLAKLWKRCIEVQPVEELRDRAIRLLNLHALRAADALQLAAALDWFGERTSGAGFVCLDGRLRAAALREGFDVAPLPEEIHEP
jgi:predicted nucleic acid-binding protein